MENSKLTLKEAVFCIIETNREINSFANFLRKKDKDVCSSYAIKLLHICLGFSCRKIEPKMWGENTKMNMKYDRPFSKIGMHRMPIASSQKKKKWKILKTCQTCLYVKHDIFFLHVKFVYLSNMAYFSYMSNMRYILYAFKTWQRSMERSIFSVCIDSFICPCHKGAP